MTADLETINNALHDLCGDLRIPVVEASSNERGDVAAALKSIAAALLATQEDEDLSESPTEAAYRDAVERHGYGSWQAKMARDEWLGA